MFLIFKFLKNGVVEYFHDLLAFLTELEMTEFPEYIKGGAEQRLFLIVELTD